MTITRQAQSDFGWLIDAETIESVHLPELLAIRQRYPRTGDQAIALKDSTMDAFLDIAIEFALLSIGFVGGKEGFTFLHPTRTLGSKKRAKAMRKAARLAWKAVKGADDLGWDEDEIREYDESAVLLKDALGDGGQALYDLFDPPADIDPEIDRWYQWFGYPTLADWLDRPLWWQESGEFASEAEADAELDRQQAEEDAEEAAEKARFAALSPAEQKAEEAAEQAKWAAVRARLDAKLAARREQS